MPRRRPDLPVRIAFALLVLLGVTTAVARTVAPANLGALVEPQRAQMFDALGLTQPNPELRAAAIAAADAKFAEHRAVTRLHVITGAGFLLLAVLQVTRRVRTRTPRVHRITGRVAIGLAWLSGMTGLFFGLWQPIAGFAESIIVGAVGFFVIVAVSLALRHIRAGRVAQHREWMLRAVAAAIAPAAIRVIAIPLDIALSPQGVDVRVVFVLSLWVGWMVTMAGSEWWIRSTRPPLSLSQR